MSIAAWSNPSGKGGDGIVQPSLAGTSVEQGRREMRHIAALKFGLQAGAGPASIYTVPELAGVGCSRA